MFIDYQFKILSTFNLNFVAVDDPSLSETSKLDECCDESCVSPSKQVITLHQFLTESGQRPQVKF